MSDNEELTFDTAIGSVIDLSDSGKSIKARIIRVDAVQKEIEVELLDRKLQGTGEVFVLERS